MAIAVLAAIVSRGQLELEVGCFSPLDSLEHLVEIVIEAMGFTPSECKQD